VVFLVPASTDRSSLARPLRELLSSAAGSLETIGASDSQVRPCTRKPLNRLCAPKIRWHGHFLLTNNCIIFSLFQFGVVVYGYRPKLWFLLNRHGRSETLFQEIQSTPFDESPGNNIGQFLSHLFYTYCLMCVCLCVTSYEIVCLPLQVRR